MPNYASTSDCKILFKRIWDHVDEQDADDYISLAHDWLIDSCSPFFIPPPSSPSNLLILAEANYAVFLMLRADYQVVKSLPFQQEAWKLIKHITASADTDDSVAGGPASASSHVDHVFSTGKFDSDGNFIGNKMGIQDDNKGSLDDW
ncbi:MAG: hypothetical protein D4S01_07315 [Dehalococcoidia bacterium]|nr:MAG: hypothetical protein D4S01_07315 [Dehalococcoidia bacterium]